MRHALRAALTAGVLAISALATAAPAHADSPSQPAAADRPTSASQPAGTSQPAAAPTGTGQSATNTSQSATNTGQPAAADKGTAPAAQPAAGSTDTTPPGPVTGLGLTDNTINSITLSWTNPTDADLAHLLIRRAAGTTAPAAGQGTLVATLGATKTSFTDSGLAAASTYSYAVFATDKAGNQSSAATITVSTAATDAHTGLRGKITDSAGHGIGNVLVHIRLGAIDAADAVTSSTGAYTVTNLVPGNYTLCFEPQTNVSGSSLAGYLAECYKQQPFSAYPTTLTPVTVTAGAITANVNDTLAAAGGISGRITDINGSPISGVVVTASNYLNGTETSISAADGSYLLKNLRTDIYGTQLCYATDQAHGPSPDGYLSGCDNIWVDLSAGTLTQHDHLLDVGGIITGVVRNSAGDPVAGASVTPPNGGNPVVTGTDGQFRFGQLRSGTYYLCADGSTALAGPAAPFGYINMCGQLPVAVTVQVNQTVTQDLLLSRAGALGGILAKSDGSPSTDTLVLLYDSSGYSRGDTRTDAQGHWQISLTPGTYQVCYTPYDPTDVWTCHAGKSFQGSQPTGDPISVTEASLTPVNDTLLAGGTIAGTITGPDGAPLANALLNVSDAAGFEHLQAQSDDAGHYSVTGLPAGQYQVCVDPIALRQPGTPGYAPQCYGQTSTDRYPYAISISPGQQVTADLQLALAAEIVGRVTDSAGDPISSVLVQLTDQDGNFAGNLYTDGYGNVDFYQLPAGDYTICFDATYANPAPPAGYLNSCWQDRAPGQPGDPVHTVAGQVSTVNATLASAGGVAGTVTDSSGNPVSYLPIQILSADGTLLADGQTDYAGNYQVTGLPAVPVAVCFSPYDWQGYLSSCYANAPDYHSATLVTLTAGTIVSGIDASLAPDTSAQAPVNRPALSGRV